jgi:hypothetical protein
MENPRLSLEQFKTLFAGKFESPEELLREYESFLAVFEQLDEANVPELTAGQKAEIFRRSWQPPIPRLSWAWAWLALLKRPAVTFALGLVLGGVITLVSIGNQPITPAAKAAEAPLAVEQTRFTQTYTGKALQGLYPQIENPKMIVEKTQETETPQRVLYGTLDEGEVYVVWNL